MSVSRPPGLPAALPSDLVERLARGLHLAYVKRRAVDHETVTANPSMATWERLPAYLQESNREAVRNTHLRLRVLGFALVPDDHPAPPVAPLELAPHVELLARLGHIYWNNERLALGWHQAEGSKDSAAHTHPSIVPWEALSEVEQTKDREQVMDLLALFIAAGWRLTRVPMDPDPQPPSEPAPAEVVYEDAPADAPGRELEALAEGLYRARQPQRGWNGEGDAAPERWTLLSQGEQGLYRAAAWDFREQLEVLGYRVARAAPIAPIYGEVSAAEFTQQVEILAQLAHCRWLNGRLAEGWGPGPDDAAARTHPHLAPWDQLPESERDRGRAQVRDLLRALAAGDLRLERYLPATAPGRKVGVPARPQRRV